MAPTLIKMITKTLFDFNFFINKIKIKNKMRCFNFLEAKTKQIAQESRSDSNPLVIVYIYNTEEQQERVYWVNVPSTHQYQI